MLRALLSGSGELLAFIPDHGCTNPARDPLIMRGGNNLAEPTRLEISSARDLPSLEAGRKSGGLSFLEAPQPGEAAAQVSGERR